MSRAPKSFREVLVRSVTRPLVFMATFVPSYIAFTRLLGVQAG